MGEFRVCVVGAGAGGLSMARALARHGIAYDHFERHSGIGGVWDQANPGSPMYDSAHMISSKTMSGFLGFPMPARYPDYPSHRQIMAYIRAFADAYDLPRGIEFGKSVTRATKRGDQWEVTISDGSERRYDALVAATGLAWHPRMPHYPGVFSGEIIHSSQYRSADQFRGKRVLIVGAGNSGVDIASDASRSAERALLSMRRAYHFIPKHIFGKPADVFAVVGSRLPIRVQQWVFAMLLRLLNGNVTRHGLRRPDHPPLSSHPIVNSTALLAMTHGDLTPKVDIERYDGDRVVFKDGSSEAVDLIVAATGYVHKVPFVDPELIASEGEESNHFLRSISRRDHSFAVIGFLEINGGIYPFYDQFADIIANFYRELAARSPKAKIFADIVQSGRYDISGSVRYVDSPRHRVYANALTTTRMLRKLRREMGWSELATDRMKPPFNAQGALKTSAEAAG